jgi:hypothetical protein
MWRAIKVTTAALVLLVAGSAIQGLILDWPLPDFQLRLMVTLLLLDLVLFNFSWFDSTSARDVGGIWISTAWVICAIALTTSVIAVLGSSWRMGLLSFICCALGWVVFAVQDNE